MPFDDFRAFGNRLRPCLDHGLPYIRPSFTVLVLHKLEGAREAAAPKVEILGYGGGLLWCRKRRVIWFYVFRLNISLSVSSAWGGTFYNRIMKCRTWDFGWGIKFQSPLSVDDFMGKFEENGPIMGPWLLEKRKGCSNLLFEMKMIWRIKLNLKLKNVQKFLTSYFIPYQLELMISTKKGSKNPTFWGLFECFTFN